MMQRSNIAFNAIYNVYTKAANLNFYQLNRKYMKMLMIHEIH